MHGSLGDKIAEGSTADVHAWAPGQVLKLFKAGVSPRFARHEARMTRAAFAAGAPAPEVRGEILLDGRLGLVLARFDGPTLRHLLLTRALTYEQAGGILATLYFSVHGAPSRSEVPSLRDWIDAASRGATDVLPVEIAIGVIALIERLSLGDGLCHADLHPGNVIMTADGPKVIDWACAVRAPGIIDIGRCHVTLSEIVPDDTDPELPRAINAAVQSEYARLAGVWPAALTATMQPYLPILRALVLLQRRPATSAQREQLVQRIAADLLSAG